LPFQLPVDFQSIGSFPIGPDRGWAWLGVLYTLLFAGIPLCPLRYAKTVEAASTGCSSG
jgi:hypothetical protein